MSRLIKVDGNPARVRDPNSGAILNINKNEIEAAKQRKKLLQEKKQEEAQLKEDVANLKDEIKEIKNLLTKLAEKL